MRNIILLDEFHQTDFNPSQFFNKYLELTQKDIGTYFLKSGELKECNCPACDAIESKSSFTKFGMTYLECSDCGTLRISPRPDDQKLITYFKESSAEQYWRDELSKETENIQQLAYIKLIKPAYDIYDIELDFIEWIERLRQSIGLGNLWLKPYDTGEVIRDVLLGVNLQRLKNNFSELDENSLLKVVDKSLNL